MRRYLSLYFPNWAIDLTLIRASSRREKFNGPIALIRHGDTPHVMRVCRRAAAEGVAGGIPLSLAKVMAPSLITAPFLPERDFQSLVALGFWALKKISPVVGVDTDLLDGFRSGAGASVRQESYGLIADITGTQKLHKDEDSLIHKILMEISAAGIEARIGIAPTVGMAWGLARYATSAVKPSAAIHQIEYEALNMPLAALRIEPGVIQDLERLGIKTIRQLLKISIPEIGKRFGGQTVRRLNQFTGRGSEVFPTLHEKRPYLVTKRFEYPLSAREVLSASIYELFDALFTMLSGAGREANSYLLTLEIQGIDGRLIYKQKELFFHKPPGTRADLSAVVGTALETFTIPGDVNGIRIEATEHSPIKRDNKTLPLFTSDGKLNLFNKEERHGIDELLNHFVVRLGKEQVLEMELQESFVPEKAFKLSPLGKREAPLGVLKERPSYLFAAPEQVDVVSLLPDFSPSLMIWKGEKLKIITGSGPERILNEWWRNSDKNSALSGRDYFKVQDANGRWLWLYRDISTLEWFVHGVWI